MRALVVVVMQPFVEIGLKHIDAVIEFLAERDLIEFLQDGLVGPLEDAMRLRRFHLGFGVIDVIDRQNSWRLCLST